MGSTWTMVSTVITQSTNPLINLYTPQTKFFGENIGIALYIHMYCIGQRLLYARTKTDET